MKTKHNIAKIKFKDKLMENGLFIRNFFIIFLTLTLVLTSFTIYCYSYTSDTIESEITDKSVIELQNVATYLDNYMMDIRYMISSLIINDSLQFFYSSKSPEKIWENYYSSVHEQLRTLEFSLDPIQEIYLYSEISGMIYSGNVYGNIDQFSDTDWLMHLSADQNGFSYFPYAINGKYPFCICIAKEFTTNNSRSVVAIMVDLSRLTLLKTINQNKRQSFLLISDDNNIIYRYNQSALLEPLETVALLTLYEPDEKESTLIKHTRDTTYSFAQLHSSEYPWTYVMTTQLQDYESKLSSVHATFLSIAFTLIVFTILFALFYTFRSSKPIQEIRSFLEHPEFLSSGKVHESKDINYIVGRIIELIQTNNEINEELQNRLQLLNDTQIRALQSQINPHFLFNTLNLMYIQATDALGYDHKLPQTIVSTGSLIRYALNSDKMVDLKTELTHNNQYLTILDQRYYQNLKVIQNIDPDTLKAKVPRLFIQPFIENAIFHGFSQEIDSNCILTINITRKWLPEHDGTNFVVVQISDNGNGMSAEKLSELQQLLNQDALMSNKSIGLRNVIQRMNLIYSDNFFLDIESSPGKGSCFTLQFPYIE
ncbi:MAG: histidine kinase [Lachnospiraceae bacterium]|nr:histidine kinase [Lachnospiraceae bacterium]